jgi:hypothetical protein
MVKPSAAQPAQCRTVKIDETKPISKTPNANPMTSLRQIEANRRNARLSTGPVTDEGKKRSRRNALRHGLTAETVIDALEDAKDYAAFEMAVKSDYDAQTAVERELVLRLASLLWRLRRATAIESGLFKVQARDLLRSRQPEHQSRLTVIDNLTRNVAASGDDNDDERSESPCGTDIEATPSPVFERADGLDELTGAFVGLTSLPTYPLDRLNRYEAALWRQARQILLVLQRPDRRKPWERAKFRSRPFVRWPE